MNKIIYRLTLDTHKNGIQKTLQGFQTADNNTRRIVISLVAGGDSYEFDGSNTTAIAYVTTPNTTIPNTYDCTIKDNSIIYDVPSITEEGISEVQIKLVETGEESVLATPKFAIEVLKSLMDDEG